MADSDRGESGLLTDLDEIISRFNGTLVTWNGAVFDLPFLHDRYKLHGLSTDLTLRADSLLPVKYSPTPGHSGGYQATWHSLKHHDIMSDYRQTAADMGVSWSLKPVALALGLQPVEVDRTAMHLLSPEQLTAYVASDARMTRLLAEMSGSA